MFDITYLLKRCIRFIRRYPRTWTIIGFLAIFGIGIWVGREVRFDKIPDYFKSYTDFERSDETRQVSPGIIHRQMLDNGVLTNILFIRPESVAIRPIQALSAGIGTETLPSLAQRHNAPIAINGGFYEMSGTFRGESVGALKIDGKWMSEPEQGRGVVAFKYVDGQIETYMDRIVLQQDAVFSNGASLTIDGINRGRLRNELVLYRPNFHSVTLTMSDGVEVVVRNNEITDIRNGKGSTHIPSDGYVLSAHGRKHGLLLREVRLGDKVKIQEKIIPESTGDSNLWKDFSHIIGGGPLLLRDGIKATTKSYEQEGFDRSFHSFWHPRTAVGKTADGTLLFVTITAANPGVRRGVMLQKLAKLFLDWGATDAVNLDGGFSSMMVIRNEVVSVKRRRPTRAPSQNTPRQTPPEKQPEKNTKPVSAEEQPEKEVKVDSTKKQSEKNTKPGITEKQSEKEVKPDASKKKQEPQKAAPAQNTRTGRGNRRIRPMPTYQGRAISDAILIYPRSRIRAK